MEVTRAFAVLGLGPGASADDVRRAYRGAVRRLHPDTGSGDVAALSRVARAYRTIAAEARLSGPEAIGGAGASSARHVDVYA